MPSYLITGVSRGLGWEFLRQLSQDQDNTVVGIVRNKAATDARVSEELSGRSNITIIEADLNDVDSLKRSVASTEKVTGGGLDYLIANAASLSYWDNFASIDVLRNQDPDVFEKELATALHVNITCQIRLISLYMPLILKGNDKKVIYMSSGHGDPDIARDYDVSFFPIYAISKAGMNMGIAKFSAQYRQDGVLFISLSPGVADVGHYKKLTPQQEQAQMENGMKLMKYAPHFRGPATPEDAIKDCLSTIKKASIENGDAGAFLSHRGEKGNWL